jgi:MFS family permease
MIAMALGNIWGGRLADKNPSPDKMYMRILIVGVWIAATPLVGKYVIAGVSLLFAMLVSQAFLIWASLFSCILLFVFPLMLLGSVSPALVKYAVQSLDENGRVVGELNALNTIGSIIGTFAPTFITIPLVGTAWTFLIFAAILILLTTAITAFSTYKAKRQNEHLKNFDFYKMSEFSASNSERVMKALASGNSKKLEKQMNLISIQILQFPH